jgi:hypothetical protein
MFTVCGVLFTLQIASVHEGFGPKVPKFEWFYYLLNRLEM